MYKTQICKICGKEYVYFDQYDKDATCSPISPSTYNYYNYVGYCSDECYIVLWKNSTNDNLVFAYNLIKSMKKRIKNMKNKFKEEEKAWQDTVLELRGHY